MLEKSLSETAIPSSASSALPRPRPRIAGAGLNPHAGEGGLFGGEEGRVIAPAIADARNAGIDAEGPFGALLEAKKVPPFKDLFRQASELGDAKVYPCSMACDVLGVEPKDLEPYLQEPLGLTKFLADAEGSQIYTF